MTRQFPLGLKRTPRPYFRTLDSAQREWTLEHTLLAPRSKTEWGHGPSCYECSKLS